MDTSSRSDTSSQKKSKGEEDLLNRLCEKWWSGRVKRIASSRRTLAAIPGT
jgi:hypothetical protein